LAGRLCHPIREADCAPARLSLADLRRQAADVSGAVFPTLNQINIALHLITRIGIPQVGATLKLPVTNQSIKLGETLLIRVGSRYKSNSSER